MYAADGKAENFKAARKVLILKNLVGS